jgi:hypothetical protein
MNLLYFRASWDYDFLMKSHEAVIKTDVFIRKLSEIMTKVRQEGVRQTKTLVLQRADYMCHAPDGRIKGLKQVYDLTLILFPQSVKDSTTSITGN